MNSFEEGYEFYRKHSGAALGAFSADAYVSEVEKAIEALEKDINSFEGFGTKAAQLKGDVFEFWHADTFNIDAALKASNSEVYVNRSHDFASPDISSNFGKDFGLKAYSDGGASAQAQATSVFQRFKEYESRGGTDDFDTFLKDRGYDTTDVLNDPIYSGQVRVIPRDQLEEARAWLDRRIATETFRRPEQVERFKDARAFLTEKLSDGKGVESIELSKKEAEEIARLAKEGGFNAEDYGLTPEELVKYEYVAQQALKSGLTAATISMVLKVAPEIFKTIDYLIKAGELDYEQVKRVGSSAISGASEGFIRGSVSGAITTVCKSGQLGEAVMSIDSSIIAAVTVITMNAIKNSFDVAKGEKSKRDFSMDLIRDMYVSACALVGGTIAQASIELPCVGYMIGSFLGSVFGSFTFNAGQKATLALCVDSGFTMFGLVEQDYTLPKEVIKEIGLSTFDYETFEPDTFDYNSFSFDSFECATFEPASLDITFLRRGVIGVGCVGYVY